MRAIAQSYAVTIVCAGRARVFQTADTSSLMVSTLFRYRDQGRYRLHAFVVMPDHLHVLFSPEASLEQTIGLIKGGFSFAVRRQHRGSVWQEGYYAHRVIDKADYESQVAYIAANPERKCLDNYPFVHTRSGFVLDVCPDHLGG